MNARALRALRLAPGVSERAVERGARPISVIGAVEPRAFGPDVLRTPCASVQQIGVILGVVSVAKTAAPVGCTFSIGPVRSRPVPLAPAVPTFAIVTCSAFDMLLIQIVWPAVKPATLATLTLWNVCPAPEYAASFVTGTPYPWVCASGDART